MQGRVHAVLTQVCQAIGEGHAASERSAARPARGSASEAVSLTRSEESSSDSAKRSHRLGGRSCPRARAAPHRSCRGSTTHPGPNAISTDSKTVARTIALNTDIRPHCPTPNVCGRRSAPGAKGSPGSAARTCERGITGTPSERPRLMAASDGVPCAFRPGNSNHTV